MHVRLVPLLLALTLACLLPARVHSQASNDNFAQRLTLGGTSPTAVSNLAAATHEPGEPNHANGGGARSLWWTWTAPSTGTVNFSAYGGVNASSGTNIGASGRSLAVYTGNAVNALTEVASATTLDLFYPGFSEFYSLPAAPSFNVAVTAGTVYQIAVDGPAYFNLEDDGIAVLAINQAPTIYSAAGASATGGAAFSYAIEASNNPTGYTAANLPAGLSLNSSLGIITGTPQTPGVYPVRLTAANPGGTGAATLTITVLAAVPSTLPGTPVIGSSAAASGVAGAPFSYYLSASGSPRNYGASNLPAGLTVDASSGLIAGLPTAAGVYQVPVTAQNAAGIGSATVAISIAATVPQSVITSSLSAAGTLGSSFLYSINTNNYSPVGPISYGAANLPPGLGFNSLSGYIEGAPTQTGSYSVPITVTNAGVTDSAVVTITVTQPTVAATPTAGVPQLFSSAAVAGVIGTSFASVLQATGLPTSFSANNLPLGLSLNPQNGVITGTPVATGVFAVPVSASNTYGTSSGTLTITIAAAASSIPANLPPIITGAAEAAGTVGQSMSYVISTQTYGVYGYGNVIYSAANLPPGLTVNASSGTIGGTPTTAGTYAATVSVRAPSPINSYPQQYITGSAMVSFVIAPTAGTAAPSAAPVVTSAATAVAAVGSAFAGYTLAASNAPTGFTASGLPSGLSLNAASGAITGTPTAAGTYPVAVSATNSIGTGSATVTFMVTAAANATAPPVFSNAATAGGTLGSSLYFYLSASNSPSVYGASSLPPGMSFNTASGYFSGVPTATGTYTVPISATNAGGTANATLTFTISPSVAVVPSFYSSAATSGIVGTSLTYYLYATSSPTSFGATNLPPGLTLNTATGYISGSPTAGGDYAVPVSATNAAGTGNAVVTFAIAAVPPAPVFSDAAAASGTVGVAFSYSLYATNSPTSYGASNLPPGLTLNTATGSISGTPTTADTYPVPVSASNNGGTANATLTLTIASGTATPPAPVVSSAAAAAGTVGGAFSYTVTAANSPTSFTLPGSAPPGLSFNATTGVFSGTPTSAGTYAVPVSASNAGGTGSATLTLTFGAPASAPVITSAAGANANIGDPFYYYVTATNLPTSYAATGLPPGFTINGTSGLISGTLTSSQANYVTVTATNSFGQGTASVYIQSNYPAARISSSLSAAGVVGTAFSYTIGGNYSAFSYSASSLPPGLGVSSSTGVISGTPTTPGTYTATVSCNTSSYGTATGKVTIDITAAASSKPVFSSSAGANAAMGDPFYYYLTASNSPTSLSVTNLPAGLSFNATQGLISGTPTVYGMFSLPVSATNSSGATSGTLTLDILSVYNVRPRVSSAAGASATVGTPFSYTAATNVPGAYQLQDYNLPPGLVCNNYTLTITGTPTAPGTYGSEVYINTSYGQAFSYLTIAVGSTVSQPPVITSSAAAAGVLGAPFSYTLAASNAPTSLSATNLPAGLTFNSAKGQITGIPTVTGTFSLPISASNALGTGSATLTVGINAAPNGPPGLSGNSLAVSGYAGSFMVYQIQATNPPVMFTASGLPSGLSLDPVSGAISGTPLAAGIYPINVSAANATGTSGAVVTLAVLGGTSMPSFASYGTEATVSGIVGTSFSTSVSAGGSPATYAATGLPPGLYLNSGTGQIYGVPTAPGSYSVALSAVNAAGTDYVTVTTVISSQGAPALSGVPAEVACLVGDSCSTSFYAGESVSYQASGLPPGLVLSYSAGNGYFYGSPTVAGVYPVTLTASSASGTATAVVTITVGNAFSAAPIITSAAGASGSVGNAFNYFLTAADRPASYGFSGLPAGLQGDPVSGAIFGIPTTTGNYPVTVSATNASGTGNAIVTVQITSTPAVPAAAPVITSPAQEIYLGHSVGELNETEYYFYVEDEYYYESGTSSLTSFGYSITASNAPTSFGANNLPPGLSLNPYTGVISGDPAAIGTYTVPISATNAAGTTNATLTIVTCDDSPVLTAGLTASGVVGSSLSYIFSSNAYYAYYDEDPFGGALGDPTSYTAAGLPPGLSLDSSTGTITGTPEQAGIFPVDLSATNIAGTSSSIVTFDIAATAPPVVSTGSVSVPSFSGNAAEQGFVGAPLNFNLFAGTASYSASGLPPGVSLNPATGQITGTPTAAGTSVIPVSATNASGTGTATLTLIIGAAPPAPIISSAAAASATVGTPFVYAISTSYSGYTLTPAAYGTSDLPPGLSCNSSNGLISGTPTQAGTFPITISAATDGVAGNALLALTVQPAPATPAIPAAPIDPTPAGSLGFTANPFVYTLAFTGFAPASALPQGLAYNSVIGNLFGWPTAGGIFDVALSATNTGGTGQAGLNVRVIAPDASLPRITVQPLGQTVAAGANVTLTAAAVSVPAPTFQWLYNGIALAGATSSTLNFTAVQSTAAGTYALVAGNASGSATSAAVVLRVIQNYAAWQAEHFTPPEIAAGLGADLADFNGDGLANLLEYALDRDPKTGNGGSLPVGSQAPGGALQLQFTRDASETDITYTVEASSDLQAWTAIACSTAGGATTNLGGAGLIVETAAGGSVESVTVQDSQTLAANGARFMRLSVSRP